MLLNFKDIGDSFTMDEYNAIVYLLRKTANVSERVVLTQNSYVGEYGVYTLITPKEDDFIVRNNSFVVQDPTKNFILSIDNSFSGIYQLKIYITTLNDSGEQVDDEDVTVEVSTRTKVYYGINLEGNRQEIIIPLSDFKIGDLISFDAEINIDYSQPVIDKLSGPVNDDLDQNLIETTDALISAVANAPVNEETTLYLKPGVTFDLSNVNMMTIKNKSIVIQSGNIPCTFDAGKKHRHFLVKNDGKLTLKNLILINGYDNGGGSILLESETDSGGNFTQAELYCTEVTFQNNQSSTVGGVVESQDCKASFIRCNFFNNKAQDENTQVYGSGGAIYNKGNESPIIQALNTTTVITTDKTEIILGKILTLTANVKDSDNKNVNGLKVLFYEGNIKIGESNTNSQGNATFNYTCNTVGTFKYHSVCVSTPEYNTSTSSEVSVTVSRGT